MPVWKKSPELVPPPGGGLRGDADELVEVESGRPDGAVRLGWAWPACTSAGCMDLAGGVEAMATPLSRGFAALLSSSPCRCLLQRWRQEQEIQWSGSRPDSVAGSGLSEDGWRVWRAVAGSDGGRICALFVQ